jgi:hypothetical protein
MHVSFRQAPLLDDHLPGEEAEAVGHGEQHLPHLRPELVLVHLVVEVFLKKYSY